MARETDFTGTIKRVIWQSPEPESDFAILLIEKDGGYDKAKVKGDFPFVPIKRGTRLQVSGEWSRHPEYGWTMKADRAKEVIDTEEGLKRFLEENVRNIGPKTSEKLVDQFGTGLIEILNESPEEVAEDADYLRSDQREELIDKWEETKQRDELAIWLYGLGLSSGQSSRAVNKFGADLRDKIEDDPFCLLEVGGIGFKTCDLVCQRLKFSKDSLVRVKGSIRWGLFEASRGAGHLYLTLPELRESVHSLMKDSGVKGFDRAVSEDKFDVAVSELVDSGAVIEEDGKVYLKTYFHFEDYCAARVARWSKKRDLNIDVETYLEKWERDHTLTLSEEQREAVHALNETRFLILAGLPGTGKTTIVKALTGLFDKAGLRFHLMSPTGIAAKRLSNVTGHDASTIHRQLGYGGKGRWEFDRTNKFPTDAVIVDEASMVSQELLYRLVSALERRTALVLVGDHAQLPSVGAGNVLQELMECPEVEDVRLTKIFRQEEASDLVLNAHRINAGKKPEIGDPRDNDTDFKFIQDEDKDSIVDGILTIASKIDRSGAEFQVLSPRYAGTLGVDKLNDRLRQVLNPPASDSREHEFANMSLREGDRVMVTENDYELEVFNGEVGYVSSVNKQAKTIRLQLDEPEGLRTVPMDFSVAARILTHAYCTTVHKCQGQEYDYIVFPFVKDYGIQLQRNLFYTAITRAKKKVFVIGEWAALVKAVRNEDNRDRNTRLAEKIVDYTGSLPEEDEGLSETRRMREEIQNIEI